MSIRHKTIQGTVYNVHRHELCFTHTVAICFQSIIIYRAHIYILCVRKYSHLMKTNRSMREVYNVEYIPIFLTYMNLCTLCYLCIVILHYPKWDNDMTWFWSFHHKCVKKLGSLTAVRQFRTKTHMWHSSKVRQELSGWTLLLLYCMYATCVET